MAEALNLHGGEKGNKRRELDFYPTPPNVTHALMKFLYAEKLVSPYDVVWEPACGNGAMSEVVKKYVIEVYSSDIRDTGYGMPGLDYLNTKHEPDGDIGAIITNPPFKLADKFIEQAIADAPLVAMLLKSQYWHASKRTDLFRKYPPAYVLPLNWRPDFMNNERGGAPVMECLWTVWIRGETDTRYRILERPK